MCLGMMGKGKTCSMAVTESVEGPGDAMMWWCWLSCVGVERSRDAWINARSSVRVVGNLTRRV
jgi:hypothetical protein